MVPVGAEVTVGAEVVVGVIVVEMELSGVEGAVAVVTLVVAVVVMVGED